MATAQRDIQTETNTKKHPTPKSFWDRFLGKRIVIQTRGRAIITGIYRECTPDHFLALEQAVIKGTRTVKPPEVYVAIGNVGHIHEECELEPKEPREQ